MEKTIICGIPMRKTVSRNVYSSDDRSVPACDKAVRYPVNSFLSRTLKKEDRALVIQLIKVDEFGYGTKNADDFASELSAFNQDIGAEISYRRIETNFSEEKAIHDRLLMDIIDNLTVGTHIIADITYGSKDVPIVLLTALSFAERYLRCSVENILYGQATFDEGNVIKARLCDVSPLYYLNNVANTLHCEDPQKAKKMLRALLSL